MGQLSRWYWVLFLSCSGSSASDDGGNEADGQSKEEIQALVEDGFEQLASAVLAGESPIDAFPASLPGVEWQIFPGAETLLVAGVGADAAPNVLITVPLELQVGTEHDGEWAPTGLGIAVRDSADLDPITVRDGMIADFRGHLAESDTTDKGQRRQGPQSTAASCASWFASVATRAAAGVAVGAALCVTVGLQTKLAAVAGSAGTAAVPYTVAIAVCGGGVIAGYTVGTLIGTISCRNFLECTRQAPAAVRRSPTWAQGIRRCGENCGSWIPSISATGYCSGCGGCGNTNGEPCWGSSCASGTCLWTPECDRARQCGSRPLCSDANADQTNCCVLTVPCSGGSEQCVATQCPKGTTWSSGSWTCACDTGQAVSNPCNPALTVGCDLSTTAQGERREGQCTNPCNYNGTCDEGETVDNCDDCTETDPCGDGICDWDEDTSDCSSDCYCGNGSCEYPSEDAMTCLADCGCAAENTARGHGEGSGCPFAWGADGVCSCDYDCQYWCLCCPDVCTVCGSGCGPPPESTACDP